MTGQSIEIDDAIPTEREGAKRVNTVTDYDSKTVMLAAERKDRIHITEAVRRFEDDVAVPGNLSVIKRSEAYYGPELLVHAEVDGQESNFLLNAPGPDCHLFLWAGETTDSNKRKGWFPAAEVKAVLSTEQPPYEKCDQCGELIRTIQHEREAVIGQCSRADTWK